MSAAHIDWKAVATRLFEHVSHVAQMIEDEGDRIFFGSTNDADLLRDIKDEYTEIAVMGERPMTLAEENRALLAQAKRAEAETARLETERDQAVAATLAMTQENARRMAAVDQAVHLISQAALAMGRCDPDCVTDEEWDGMLAKMGAWLRAQIEALAPKPEGRP